MMVSTIALATKGRISPTTKRTLTLATIGWLLGIGPQAIYQPAPVFEKKGGTGDRDTLDYLDIIRKQDNEIVDIIKMFLKCLD